MSKISVCCTIYFRNHISYDIHLWYTCMHKRMISAAMFFTFFKILIFRIIRDGREKCKKWPKMTRKFCPYLRNHTSYDCDFWCTCVKWWYLQQIFHFLKVWFLRFLGGWSAKNDQFQFVLVYISGTVDHSIEILIMTSTGVFHYFFKKRNIVNIKIMFFIGQLQKVF